MSTRRLLRMYDRLLDRIGPRHWWPADTAEEVMIGAILTQNTGWTNVAQAIAALRRDNRLSLAAIAATPEPELAALVRPARYFNQKARALRTFAEHVNDCYDFQIERMAARDTSALRSELLGLYRIGPETADSILLYALHKPVFVIDAYTRRIFSRHGLVPATASYEECQRYCMDRLPPDVQCYNEFHALIVHVGATWCKPRPDCAACPLRRFRRTNHDRP